MPTSNNRAWDTFFVRPCGYFSYVGTLYDIASKGRTFLVGAGTNKMNPIHDRDLAYVCVYVCVCVCVCVDNTAGEIDAVAIGAIDLN